MRKLIISITILLLFSVWGFKFCKLNNGFKVDNPYPIEYYSMSEKVKFDGNMSYGGAENSGYSISLDNARIAETDDIKKNSGIFENYSAYGEKCLILSFTIFNDNADNIEFNILSLPVMGVNWYSLFSYEITGYLNSNIKDDLSRSGSISIPKGEMVRINIAYELFKSNFSKENWNNFEKQDIWVWLAISPQDKRIKVSL